MNVILDAQCADVVLEVQTTIALLLTTKFLRCVQFQSRPLVERQECVRAVPRNNPACCRHPRLLNRLRDNQLKIVRPPAVPMSRNGVRVQLSQMHADEEAAGVPKSGACRDRTDRSHGRRWRPASATVEARITGYLAEQIADSDSHTRAADSSGGATRAELRRSPVMSRV